MRKWVLIPLGIHCSATNTTIPFILAALASYLTLYHSTNQSILLIKAFDILRSLLTILLSFFLFHSKWQPHRPTPNHRPISTFRHHHPSTNSTLDIRCQLLPMVHSDRHLEKWGRLLSKLSRQDIVILM